MIVYTFRRAMNQMEGFLVASLGSCWPCAGARESSGNPIRVCQHYSPNATKIHCPLAMPFIGLNTRWSKSDFMLDWTAAAIDL